MIFASFNGHLEVVKALLEGGADHSIQDNNEDRCISGGKRKEGKRIRSGKKKEIWYNGGDEE